MKKMKLKEIAQQLNCQFAGDGEILIKGIATLEEAHEDELTFLSNPKYSKHLLKTKAAAIILSDVKMLPEGKAALVSSNPYLTFAYALQIFHPKRYQTEGIHATAVVAASVISGLNITIGPYTVIESGAVIEDNVIIGSHCVIYPDVVIGQGSFIHSHCVVREKCRIGKNVILQNGVVIGSDGFGYAQREDKSWHKIPQTGIVIIEDNVEIGAGSTVDRATIGATVIKEGVKIDNLVQIGHACIIGKDTLLCAQVGLAGSTKVGERVILSGQVGAAGHLTIGDGVIATAQTGIPNSVAAGKIVSGYPAIDNRSWLKSSVIFNQLPRLQQEIRALKKQIKEIIKSIDTGDSPNHGN